MVWEEFVEELGTLSSGDDSTDEEDEPPDLVSLSGGESIGSTSPRSTTTAGGSEDDGLEDPLEDFIASSDEVMDDDSDGEEWEMAAERARMEIDGSLRRRRWSIGEFHAANRARAVVDGRNFEAMRGGQPRPMGDGIIRSFADALIDVGTAPLTTVMEPVGGGG